MGLRGCIGRVLYGAVFVAAVPALLAWWSASVQASPPAVHAPAAGMVAAAAGLAMMAGAMWLLWSRGGGLPMNAFPPPRAVVSWLYAAIPHPIYVGFVLCCAGASLMAGSGPGLWLATPAAALGCIAIVLGYEGPDLDRRFGPLRPRPWLSLPAADGPPPPAKERAGAAIFVMGIWLLAYEAIIILGRAPDAADARLRGEAALPVFPLAELLYASIYLAVPLAFAVAHRRKELRDLSVAGLVATGVLTLVYLCVPLVSPPRPVHGSGVLESALRFEHAMGGAHTAAWPSFHVVWAGLAARAIAPRGGALAAIAWPWAMGVAASCWLTGMHAVIDVVAGLLCWWPLLRLGRLWEALRCGAERLANSWREWRIGPVRLINHGAYAGAGGAAGVLIAAAVSGDTAGALAAALAGMAGAAVWAQSVEGSPALLRPFGYYGFLLGAAAGIVAWCGAEWIALAAAFAVAAPWAQSLGRLRCLVQGCCHGRPAPACCGIRVTDPHSRVTRMAELSGVPIHATQLYSILANAVIGCLLLRAAWLGMQASFVCGAYLMLGGFARFAEEAYRGEPQTRSFGGLNLYQWMALASVAAGLAISTFPSAPMEFRGTFGAGEALAALAAFAAFGAAMGADFPGASVRFSRLSG